MEKSPPTLAAGIQGVECARAPYWEANFIYVARKWFTGPSFHSQPCLLPMRRKKNQREKKQQDLYRLTVYTVSLACVGEGKMCVLQRSVACCTFLPRQDDDARCAMIKSRARATGRQTGANIFFESGFIILYFHLVIIFYLYCCCWSLLLLLFFPYPSLGH